MVLFGQAYDSSPVMAMSFSMYMWSHYCPGFTLIKIYVISILSWPQPDQYVFCFCSSSILIYIYIYILASVMPSFWYMLVFTIAMIPCHDTVWPIYMFHFAMILVWSIWVFLAPVWASVRSNTCSFLILCHQLTYAWSLLLCFQFDQISCDQYTLLCSQPDQDIVFGLYYAILEISMYFFLHLLWYQADCMHVCASLIINPCVFAVAVSV